MMNVQPKFVEMTHYRQYMFQSSRNLKKQSSEFLESKLLINLIYCLASCVIFPLLVPIMSLFMLIKQIVNVVLNLKYGKSFGGILQGADAVWAIEDVSKSIINAVLLIKVKQDNSQNLTQQIKELIFNKIFTHPSDFPKLTSVRLRLMGFNFLLKDQVTVDDCVSTLKVSTDIFDRSLLQEIYSEYSNQPLPKKNSALWEVLVSPKPIQWNSNETQADVFPVLVRLSHVVGDGISLTSLLSEIFADDMNRGPNKNLTYKIHDERDSPLEYTEAKNHTILFKIFLTIRNILYSVFVVLIAPMVILHQTYIREENNNALHGSHLSGEKLLVWAVEDNQKLVSVVKNIKKHAPGSKFLDIMLTAVSGSLEKHFRHNTSIPDSVTTVIPAILSTRHMDEKPILKNLFSVALLDLPILMESNSLEHRLQEVIKRTNRLRNSPDYLINYWLLNMFCGVIPEPVLQQALNTNKITMSLSNLPGIPKMSILNGCTIEDIIFHTPHRGTAGVGFSILTYDNRFQLGLAIDKSILSSKEKAQLILDDIFRQINLLHEEVCQTVPTKR